MHRSFVQKILKKVALGLFVLSALFASRSVSADTIFFSPSQSNYAVGKSFSVQILVSSPAVAVNGVSATVLFPQDKLQVISLSKADSILSLWAQDPTFSNSQGTVSLEGVVLNPGFKGSNGKVLTINFKVVGSGTAGLSFSSASLLAGENATNILRNIGTATFNTNSTEEAPAAPTVVTPTVSGNPAPLISSDTFLNQKRWYTATSSTFSWDLPADATETFLLFDKNQSSVPTKSYKPAISSKTIGDIGDGIWYLHVQHRTKSGLTGVGHYRVNVDTSAPSNVTIRDISPNDRTTSKISLAISAVDGVSSINHYQVTIDEATPVIWQDTGDGIYVTPILSPGTHSVVVKAFDEAKNTSTASTEVAVNGVKAPVITAYSKRISSTEAMNVSGTAEPASKVRLFVILNGGSNQVGATTTNAEGNFNIVVDPGQSPLAGAAAVLFDQVAFKAGSYKVWVDAVDGNDLQSYPSQSVGVVITKSLLERFGQNLSEIMSIIFPIIATIGVLVILAFIALKKFYALKSVIRKETKQSETLIHKSFNLLREDMAEYMKILEHAKSKRKLTSEEETIINRLYDDIDGAEKVIKKEVEKIEGDVR